jgi:lipid-binding SYLF domain-containing protein
MIKQAVVKCQASLVALMLALSVLPLGAAHAGSAKEIDASVDTALRQFRKEVKGADEYLSAAKGVLVMPDVKKVGLSSVRNGAKAPSGSAARRSVTTRWKPARRAFRAAIRRRASCFCS